MKNNKLIAEFMGVEKTYNPSTEKVLSYAVNDDVQCLPHELKYHTSWDWLMPVIENIDHLQYGRVKGIEDALSTRHIGDTHKAVVDFIREYNESNKMDNLPPSVQQG